MSTEATFNFTEDYTSSSTTAYRVYEGIRLVFNTPDVNLTVVLDEGDAHQLAHKLAEVLDMFAFSKDMNEEECCGGEDGACCMGDKGCPDETCGCNEEPAQLESRVG